MVSHSEFLVSLPRFQISRVGLGMGRGAFSSEAKALNSHLKGMGKRPTNELVRKHA